MLLAVQSEQLRRMMHSTPGGVLVLVPVFLLYELFQTALYHLHSRKLRDGQNCKQMKRRENPVMIAVHVSLTDSPAQLGPRPAQAPEQRIEECFGLRNYMKYLWGS